MKPRVDLPKRSGGNEGGSPRRRGKPPRDLLDFYRRWPEFREIAVALTRRAELSPDERKTINWLVLLVDRIGERDIDSLEPGGG
jgi:hypothetical protein